MALVIQQPGTSNRQPDAPDRFCLFDDDAGAFLATDQNVVEMTKAVMSRLNARGLNARGAAIQAGKLLAQARRYAAEGPARDPLWQVAKNGAATPEARAWVATVEAAARTNAGQLATTPAAPRGCKVTVGWVVARDYPKGDATVREYLGLRTAADTLDLHGLWGEREEAARLPQHQARALVRALRRRGEDVRVVRLWRWVATG